MTTIFDVVRQIPLDELRSSALGESRVSDFHCVTTWTARRQAWTGVPLAPWWTTRIGPLPREAFAVVGAADGNRSVFRTEDLFSDEVMLAWALNGSGLDRHASRSRNATAASPGASFAGHTAWSSRSPQSSPNEHSDGTLATPPERTPSTSSATRARHCNSPTLTVR